MSATHQLCTFHVAGLFLGVDVLSVQEVLRPRELARVPLATSTIEGLLNLRGQIVPAIDLRRRLGLTPRTAAEESIFMIVRTSDGQVALVADSVGDVLEVSDETFERPPDTLPPVARSFVRGVHKLPKKLLHVLDSEHTALVNAA